MPDSVASGRPSPKADDESKALFRTLVPEDDRVTVKPMFGAIAAFANGWMFMGLFATELFVRLGDADDAALRAAGGIDLEPMPGKPMRGYVTIPDWRSKPDVVRDWARRSLEHTLSLPPKK
jgi:TfoX/Sxy family transcriptional regulator of competence genes